MASSKSRDLGPAERAVYHLVEAGGVGPTHAALYRRQLGALARVGLVTRADDGAYRVVPASVPPPAPEAPGQSRPWATLVVRVPQAWIDVLDDKGPSRSEALRAVLGKALASQSGSHRRSA